MASRFGGTVYKEQLAEVTKKLAAGGAVEPKAIQSLMAATDRPHAAQTWFTLKPQITSGVTNTSQLVTAFVPYASIDVQNKKLTAASAETMLNDMQHTVFADGAKELALALDAERSRIYALDKDMVRACDALRRLQKATQQPLTLEHYAPLLRVSGQMKPEEVNPHISALIRDTERFGRPGFALRIAVPFFSMELLMAYAQYWQQTVPATILLLALLWNWKYGSAPRT
eukprot:PhM_4_TR15775/c0_g2_i1/m.40073